MWWTIVKFMLVRSRSILQTWTLLIVLLASVSKLIESLYVCLTATAECTFFYGLAIHLRGDKDFIFEIKRVSILDPVPLSKSISINGIYFPGPYLIYNNYSITQPLSRLLYLIYQSLPIFYDIFISYDY